LRSPERPLGLHELRDTVVDFVHARSNKTEVAADRLVAWISYITPAELFAARRPAIWAERDCRLEAGLEAGLEVRRIHRAGIHPEAAGMTASLFTFYLRNLQPAPSRSRRTNTCRSWQTSIRTGC
jgi:hypothetical protein